MNIGELAKFRGGIATDTISEVTSASGVTIDGVLCKDGSVTGAASGTFITTYVKAADTQGVALVNSSGTSVVTVSDAGAVTLGGSSYTGNHTVYGGFDCSKGFRVAGASAPSSGAGIEIDYGSVAAATGRLLCYDRTGAVRKAFVLDALSTDFYAGGSSIGGYSSVGAWTLGPASGFTGSHAARSSGTDSTFVVSNSAEKCRLYIAAPNISGKDAELYLECAGSNSGTLTYERANSRLYASSQTIKSGPYVAANGTSWTTNTSDERFKDDFTEIENAISIVKKLRATHWRYKDNRDNGKRHAGLIAQDLQKAGYVYAVESSDPEKLSLTYDEIHSLYVKAFQEQQAMIEALQAKVAALEAK